MSQLRSLAALGTALAATVATALVAVTPAVAGGSPAVVVSIDDHRRITMPDSIRPGVNTFDITSEKNSDFQLLQPVAGYTKAEAVRDIRNGLDRGRLRALKRFERKVTLYGGVSSAPGEPGELFVRLPAGKYWATDTNHNDPDRFVTFTVEGEDTGGTMPNTTTLTAIDDNKFKRAPKEIPRKGYLTFANNSDVNHFVEIVKLRKGKDMGDFRRWINAAKRGEGGRPPVNFRQSWGSGVNGGGIDTIGNYKLPKGDYVMICFWPDAEMDGMPHAFMGMYRKITLT